MCAGVLGTCFWAMQRCAEASKGIHTRALALGQMGELALRLKKSSLHLNG